MAQQTVNEAQVMAYAGPPPSRAGRWLVRCCVWAAAIAPLAYFSWIALLFFDIAWWGLWGPWPAWVSDADDALYVASWAGPVAGTVLALFAYFVVRRRRWMVVIAGGLSLGELCGAAFLLTG